MGVDTLDPLAHETACSKCRAKHDYYMTEDDPPRRQSVPSGDTSTAATDDQCDGGEGKEAL